MVVPLRRIVQPTVEMSSSSTTSTPHSIPSSSMFDTPLHDEDAMADPDGGHAPNHDNCDGRHDGDDPTISISSTSRMAGQTVAPFLAKHIPSQYAPLGGQKSTKSDQPQKDSNTKFCYRHRPDLKCRRTVDEPSMDNLQKVGSLFPVLPPVLISIGTRHSLPR
jgi:hypothetical protein